MRVAYIRNNQHRYTCIKKVDWYTLKFEFHYRDMSIWDWLKLSNFFHFSQNVVQYYKKVFLDDKKKSGMSPLGILYAWQKVPFKRCMDRFKNIFTMRITSNSHNLHHDSHKKALCRGYQCQPQVHAPVTNHQSHLSLRRYTYNFKSHFALNLTFLYPS